MAYSVGEIGQRAAEIQVSHLVKRFGDLYAVQDVSLRIRKGDFYTFLGPSGCGKTTLLRIIAGFTQADSGDIIFDGKPVNHLPPWKREVGMVFQNFALWPHMSVFDNIAFGLRERKFAKDAIREKVYAALKMVDLEGTQNRRPSQLSGGQQQRVALARTLVVEPRGLLLDEPLSSLDAKLRVQMRNELVRLQRDLGITTIYVTHDQEEALALSTRIAVFSKGRVVQEGTPKEVYETPVRRFVADFVGTSNVLSGTVAEVVGETVSVKTAMGAVLRIRWNPPFDSPPRSGEPLLVSIRPESIRLADVKEDITENRIEGHVRTSIYLGAQVQYEVDIGTDSLLRVNLPNPRHLPVLPEGKAVRLGFAMADAGLLLGT